MMGMGEPLLNLDNVLKATALAHRQTASACPLGALRSRRRASCPKSPKWDAPIRPKLAISLNASTEEQRRELMPITRKYHLHDLMEACRAIRCGRGKN